MKKVARLLRRIADSMDKPSKSVTEAAPKAAVPTTQPDMNSVKDKVLKSGAEPVKTGGNLYL